MAPVLVPLRPSNEHILIVRVPGARDRHGCHSTPFIVRVLRARRMVWRLPSYPSQAARCASTESALATPYHLTSPTAHVQFNFFTISITRGVAEAALYCAHRATTASSWGLCEQEGHLATPLMPPLLPPAHAAQRPLSVHRDQPHPRGHLPPFARSSEPPEDSPPAAGAESAMQKLDL
jgi:hypothetical protein